MEVEIGDNAQLPRADQAKPVETPGYPVNFVRYLAKPVEPVGEPAVEPVGEPAVEPVGEPSSSSDESSDDEPPPRSNSKPVTVLPTRHVKIKTSGLEFVMATLTFFTAVLFVMVLEQGRTHNAEIARLIAELEDNAQARIKVLQKERDDSLDSNANNQGGCCVELESARARIDVLQKEQVAMLPGTPGCPEDPSPPTICLALDAGAAL